MNRKVPVGVDLPWDSIVSTDPSRKIGEMVGVGTIKSRY